MSIINPYLVLSDSLDEDGDAELIIQPDALSDWEGEESRYLTADEAKALIDQLNKLFVFNATEDFSDAKETAGILMMQKILMAKHN